MMFWWFVRIECDSLNHAISLHRVLCFLFMRRFVHLTDFYFKLMNLIFLYSKISETDPLIERYDDEDNDEEEDDINPFRALTPGPSGNWQWWTETERKNQQPQKHLSSRVLQFQGYSPPNRRAWGALKRIFPEAKATEIGLLQQLVTWRAFQEHTD